MQSLESHFLQKLGQLLFGGDFVEIEGVGIPVYKFFTDLIFLNFSDALFIALHNLGLAIGKRQFALLFHNNNCVL
jgi:hypothetical protein